MTHLTALDAKRLIFAIRLNVPGLAAVVAYDMRHLTALRATSLRISTQPPLPTSVAGNTWTLPAILAPPRIRERGTPVSPVLTVPGPRLILPPLVLLTLPLLASLFILLPIQALPQILLPAPI
jgi:hypothetical protein